MSEYGGAPIKFPNINSSDDHHKIEEIKSYLFQLAEQLNFRFNDIEKNLRRQKDE